MRPDACVFRRKSSWPELLSALKFVGGLQFAGMESKTFFTIIVKERNPLFICVIYFV